MILETITLEHRSSIERIRGRCGHEASSHAFLSLFLWQKELGLQLYLKEDMFAVRCGKRGENCWFFPCGEQDAIVDFLKEQLAAARGPLRLCYMRNEDVQLLSRAFPCRFSVCAAPEDDEYLYDRAEQIRLQGKPFRHHRNSLNRLAQKYAVETRQITSDDLDAAACVLLNAPENGGESAGTLCARSAEQMLLQNWDTLGVSGVIAYADGHPAAIAAGGMISDRVYDICLCRQAISDPDIAVYVRHQLFSQLPETVWRINAEEDLGIDGLRKLKQGMRPVELLNMFEGVSLCEGTVQSI